MHTSIEDEKQTTRARGTAHLPEENPAEAPGSNITTARGDNDTVY